MSILTDIYHITEATSADNPEKLTTPVKKYFTFDISSLSEADDKQTTVFWNFGDAFSNDNELVTYSAIKSVVSHTYTRAGSYNVNAIATINGTLFYIQKQIEVASDSLIITPYDAYNLNSANINIFTNVEGTFIIYYTLDGSVPTSGSTLFSAPFNITTTTRIRAIAINVDTPQTLYADETKYVYMPIGNMTIGNTFIIR